jgi:hypothetical protein
MAQQSFDAYLEDALAVAALIREARDAAASFIARHTANGIGDITKETWGVGRTIDKATYDSLVTSFGNLTGSYWTDPGYNGTNIEKALTAKPT